MTRARAVLGQLGEQLACDELLRRGYEILARRYRCRVGEIDIVASDAGTVVFVEVKAREGAAFGSGADAITALKRRRIVLTAQDYLVRHRLTTPPCRFDVVTVALDVDPPRVDVYPGAFDAAGAAGCAWRTR